MENPIKLTKKDVALFEVLVEFAQEQEGIFCIEELREKMEKKVKKPFHREQAVRIIKIFQKSKILKTIDNETARIIFEKNKKVIPERLGKRHYYKFDSDSEFVHEWRDIGIAEAIKVLSQELGEKALPQIRELKSRIKTKEILEQLKTMHKSHILKFL